MKEKRLKFVNKKYVVSVDFDLQELEDMLLLEAAAARLDLGDKATKAVYLVIQDSLYAQLHDASSGLTIWYFFDSSVRKWQECDDPNEDGK